MKKTCHFYWGNTKLPWLHSLSIRSFMHHHPGWEVTVWRPRRLDDRCDYGVVSDHAKDCAGAMWAGIEVDETTECWLTEHDPKNSWTQTTRSDALRLWLLHEHGGMWSDCDVLYFGSVEGSSLDGPGLRMWWGGDGVYNSLIAATPNHPALESLLARGRRESPMNQAPGGQSPFGAELFEHEFWHWVYIPDYHQIDPTEFHHAPYTRAMHYRAARVMWASTTQSNYREKCADVPGLVPAIDRVLEALG
jgi:hypothetical protein